VISKLFNIGHSKEALLVDVNFLLLDTLQFYKVKSYFLLSVNIKRLVRFRVTSPRSGKVGAAHI
jgi:hypothetical protein